jgi:hypothetical protein
MSGQSVLAIDGLTKMAETKASGFLKGLADGGDVECLGELAVVESHDRQVVEHVEDNDAMALDQPACLARSQQMQQRLPNCPTGHGIGRFIATYGG